MITLTLNVSDMCQYFHFLHVDFKKKNMIFFEERESEARINLALCQNMCIVVFDDVTLEQAHQYRSTWKQISFIILLSYLSKFIIYWIVK